MLLKTDNKLCNIYLFQPALVVLSHEPKGATQTVAWVGKGIVYDTGGLSIKVSHKGLTVYMCQPHTRFLSFCKLFLIVEVSYYRLMSSVIYYSGFF